MKTKRNTSRQFWAVVHYRAKFEAQEIEAAPRFRGTHREAWNIATQRANRYGAALLAAGVSHGEIARAVAPMRPSTRPVCIENYMTRRERRAYQRRVWMRDREARKTRRAVEKWNKYGRVCPYTDLSEAAR